jgi:hypothetical protein
MRAKRIFVRPQNSLSDSSQPAKGPFANVDHALEAISDDQWQQQLARMAQRLLNQLREDPRLADYLAGLRGEEIVNSAVLAIQEGATCPGKAKGRTVGAEHLEGLDRFMGHLKQIIRSIADNFRSGVLDARTVPVKGDRVHRPESVTITHPAYGSAVIRDQKPMRDSALLKCLDKGLTPADWYRTLNRRVFFLGKRGTSESSSGRPGIPVEAALYSYCGNCRTSPAPLASRNALPNQLWKYDLPAAAPRREYIQNNRRLPF